MPGTYTPSKGDALSRARFLCGDTDVAGTPRFSDDEVRLGLRNTWETDFLYVYQADEAATAATVEIKDGAARVEMVLARTVGGSPQTDTFDLSTGLGTDQTWELLRAVQDLDRGWAVGLASGRSSITWIEEGVNLMPADYASGSGRRAQLLQRTWDLVLTGAALDCLGADKRQRIPLYRPRYAAAELLRMWLSRDDTLRSYSEDGVSVEWSREGVQQRIGELIGLQVLSVQSRL